MLMFSQNPVCNNFWPTLYTRANRPEALSLKNAIEANTANALTLNLAWYWWNSLRGLWMLSTGDANLAWVTTPQKEWLSGLLMLTTGKDDDDAEMKL